MAKQLFLCLMASALVFAPGCSKKQKSPTYRETIQFKEVPQMTSFEQIEILNPEQLEKDRKKYKTRGIALTATAPVAIATGTTLGIFAGSEFVGHGMAGGNSPWFFIAGVGVVACTAVIVGGFYMVGQGIHDLAKAKKLRRIQMKDAAQKRKAEREKCLSAA